MDYFIVDRDADASWKASIPQKRRRPAMRPDVTFRNRIQVRSGHTRSNRLDHLAQGFCGHDTGTLHPLKLGGRLYADHRRPHRRSTC
jgi:hypothetical protein